MRSVCSTMFLQFLLHYPLSPKRYLLIGWLIDWLIVMEMNVGCANTYTLFCKIWAMNTNKVLVFEKIFYYYPLLLLLGKFTNYESINDFSRKGSSYWTFEWDYYFSAPAYSPWQLCPDLPSTCAIAGEFWLIVIGSLYLTDGWGIDRSRSYGWEYDNDFYWIRVKYEMRILLIGVCM